MSSQNANENASRIVEIDGDVVNEIIREAARGALLDFAPSEVQAHGEAAIAHVMKRYEINLQMSLKNDPHDFGRRGVMSFMNARTGRPPFSGMDGPSNVVSLRPGRARTAPLKLRLINGNELRDMPKARPWFYVDGVIQGRKVSLLMGEDGSGKSFLMLLLAVATATGGDWLGFKVKQGPVIFLTAEEEKQDVWERIDAIEKMLGRGKLDLKDFHLVAIDESDDSDDSLVLGEPDKVGIQMTELWDAVVREVGRIKPVAVMLDPLVEIFDGDEMVRVQARQFIAPMRKLARRGNLAVYVAGHPSKTSARDKTGTAGSTGWSAIMRGRQFYEIVYDDANNDTGERRFHVKKVTGGRAGTVVEVKLNENGVPVLKNAPAVEGEPVNQESLLGRARARETTVHGDDREQLRRRRVLRPRPDQEELRAQGDCLRRGRQGQDHEDRDLQADHG